MQKLNSVCRSNKTVHEVEPEGNCDSGSDFFIGTSNSDDQIKVFVDLQLCFKGNFKQCNLDTCIYVVYLELKFINWKKYRKLKVNLFYSNTRISGNC